MRPMPSATASSAFTTPSSSSSGSSSSNFVELRRTSTKRSTGGKVRKNGKEKREKKETLERLKDLVPTVNRDQPMNNLELLQHVIDYIFDLQQQLNSDGDSRSSSPTGGLPSGIDLSALSSLFSSFIAHEPPAIKTAS